MSNKLKSDKETKLSDFDRRFKEIKAAEQESKFLAEVNSDVKTVNNLDEFEKHRNNDEFYVSDDAYFKDQSLISNNDTTDQMRFKQNNNH